MSLPAAKGFEIGSGFAGTLMTGRDHNDPFVPGPNGKPSTSTNNSGGVQGGISNGEDLIMRVAFKPTATIASPQETVTQSNEATVLAAKTRPMCSTSSRTYGRSDGLFGFGRPAITSASEHRDLRF